MDTDTENVKDISSVERKIDNVGRLVIPKKFRDYLGITEGTLLSTTISDNTLYIHKAEDICVFCNCKDDLIYFKNYTICNGCKTNLIKLHK